MRVLIAEDEPVSRRLLEGTLRRWGYDVLVACDGQEAWELFNEEDSPKLAIFDWIMPRMDGVELCQQIRRKQQENYTYVILLTARDRKEHIIEGLNAGADDYVTKPFDSDELEVRLRAARRIIDLQTKLLAAQSALRQQATHDSLTGLLNRSATLEVLQKEIDRVGREQQPLSLLLVDIDFFKNVNDTFGHRAGDVALQEISRRMLKTIRPYDSLGRYGGEEFLVILPGMDAGSAMERGEAFRQAVAAKPIEIPGGELPLTVSVGVSTTASGEPCDVEKLVHQADSAMYQAKSAGRNRVEAALEVPEAAEEDSPA